MYREAPTVANTTIWFLNDYLVIIKGASYAQSTIPYDNTILITYANSLDYGLPIWNIFNGMFEAPYHAKNSDVVDEIEGYTLKTEVTTDAIMEDWYEYLDFCCYDIMAKINIGNLTGAREIYEQHVLPKWNGSGLVDKAVQAGHPFSIFKNAMFL